jgi:GT2 family glycosyltransferase
VRVAGIGGLLSDMVGTVDKTLVTVIVVNWNGRIFLEACLGSLATQTYPNREIILVDNGSTDSSASFAKEKFPSVKVIELRENRGFSGGNLAGLETAQGKFIALVNNDTRADAKWLERLIQPMLEDPAVGICASKLIFAGDKTINSAGDGITTAAVGFNRGLNKNPGEFQNPRLAFGACGAAVLYRRKMLDEIGFFDDDFFLYDEDTDLNFRAQLAGWKCVYVPGAVVHHVANATAVRLSDTHVYYHTRNLEFVWLKNMPLGLMLRFAHHKIIQEIGAFCYLCLRHSKWHSYFRAKRDALRMAPSMWKKRKEIQRRRRASNRYLKSMMTSLFSTELIRQKIRQFIRG